MVGCRIQDFQSESGSARDYVARTMSRSTHDTTTTHHLIVSSGADKSRGLAAASGHWVWALVKESCCLPSYSCVCRWSSGSYRAALPSPLLHPPLLSATISTVTKLHGRRSGAVARDRLIMDNCEGSRPITRSGIVRENPAVMVDGMNEPVGEGLPDGWLKECRPRKNRHGSRIKGDTFYIDPINGYEFRSLKDVYRYLESGDISQCVMLPNKRKFEELHIAGDQSNHTGQPSDYTQPDTADPSNLYGLPTVGGTKPLTDVQLNPYGGENAENISSSKPSTLYQDNQKEVDRVDASQGKSIQSGSIEQTLGEVESATRKGANVEQKPKEKKHKTKPVKGIATPLRSSPRLAALKISQEANNAPKDGPISTQTDVTKQLQVKQVKDPRLKANSSVLREKKDGAPTSNSSEKVEDNHPSVCNRIPGVPYSSAEAGCQNAPSEAPVLPQEVGLAETANDMPGSALSSLFRHVWSDPCLVFAFRTLTSDIPVLDDTLAVANYFLPPQNLNNGATPNCSSSTYDGNRNHAQVDHVGLSMPRPPDKFYGSGCFPPQ